MYLKIWYKLYNEIKDLPDQIITHLRTFRLNGKDRETLEKYKDEKIIEKIMSRINHINQEDKIRGVNSVNLIRRQKLNINYYIIS